VASAPRARADLIPRAAQERLSLYLRHVELSQRAGRTTVSSAELGGALDLTPAQVRKDLSALGQWAGKLGARGVGYRVDTLSTALRAALGTDRVWPVALIGVGHLGSALIRHKQFRDQGFRFAALFDASPALVGTTLEGLRIQSTDALEAGLREASVRLAMLAVPAAAAQGVADRLVRADVKGILNFSSAALDVPRDVAVVAVDLAFYLEKLTYHLAHVLDAGAEG